jgi:ligand-binding sensor domain-containing protein
MPAGENGMQDIPRVRRSAVYWALLCSASAMVALAATPYASSAAQEFEWTTYLNPNVPNDVSVRDGTVWLTSASGGVIVYDYTDSTFSTIHRRPGGLSSNSLVRVTGDAEGRLWFAGSKSGVDVFNTNTSTWRSLTSFEGLPSDTVTVLAGLGDSMWVGTPSGFAVFRDEELAGRCNVRLPPEVRCPLLSHSIRALAPQRGGAYLGTDAGVEWFDGESSALVGGEWTLGSVIDLVVYNGSPWVLTAQGAFEWAPGEDRWVASSAGLPAASGVKRLRARGSGLYAATVSGVYEWSGTSWSRLGGEFYALSVDASETGGLWAAGLDGLYGMRDGSWHRTPAPGPSLPGGDTRSIAVGTDEIWFTGAYWTDRFDGEAWESFSAGDTDDRLQSCDVHGLLVDSSNRVWFGHCCNVSLEDSCLTDRLTRSMGSWRWRRYGIPNIWRVAEGGGAIWLAARYTGLYRIADGSAEPERIEPGGGSGLSSEALSSIAYDPARGLWIGHRQNGVDLFRGGDPQNSDNWEHVGEDEGLVSNNVRKVLVKGDKLWVGTLAGVSVVDPAAFRVVRNYTVGPGGLDDRISSVSGLAVDGFGDVWVTTDGSGVYVIRSDRSVLSFKTRNSPLADDKVSEVAYDAVSGDVWVATFRGINKITRSPTSGGGAAAELYVYPNPYCPAGCDGSEAGPLRIGGVSGPADGEIVDLKGQIVARFYDAQAGDAVFNGVSASGRPAGAGLYIVVVRSSSGTHRAKFALVR